ncbi:MAG: flagellar filament capping protein FliD [Lachnospiraceae bacterium]|nr:flagellar filament capping protein FliD [Lachnospiraceae bacterium]
MPIRMSGLSSGLDTEAIVGALMSAQTMKKTKIQNSKTKLEWTQTKWTELNNKLYKLYTDYATKMQLQSTYMAKKATVSDASKVSVKANSNAANGNYSLEVKNIATAQYLTSGKIGATSTSEKLADLDPSLLNKKITVTAGSKTSEIEITADTTIADFVNSLKNAGLNANYDTEQQRFFISSKESGLNNAFSITTTGISSAELNNREALKTAIGYSSMSKENKAVVDAAIKSLQTSGVGTDAYNKALDDIANAVNNTKTAASKAGAEKYVSAQMYAEKYAEYEAAAKESLKADYYEEDGSVKESLAEKYGNEFDTYVEEDKVAMGIQDMSKEEYIQWKAENDYNAAVAKKADLDTTGYVKEQLATDEGKLQVEAAAYAGVSEEDIQALDAGALQKYYGTGNDTEPMVIEAVEGTSTYDVESIKNSISSAVSDYAGVTDRYPASSGSALSGIGLADIVVAADGTVTVNGGANDAETNPAMPSGMALIAASDSEIILNGAKLTSSSSTVSVNGLEIELTGLTDPGEKITFSVSNDVDGVYNTIKDFLKEYNALLTEMNTLYNADRAKGYEPLTSEEKEAMTDEDVKLWEDKIKDGLLSGDSTLNSIMTGMRSAMMSQVSYNGKTYSLASFGIMTSMDYTERGLLHIYGDTDDSTYAAETDKLRTALANDPEAVISVLSGVFGNLRQTMSDKMAGSKVSSALTFYNDIKMKDDLKEYEKQIKEWEERLTSLEDSYYKKFTAMETALAKLQSQQSTLAGLFGGY